MPSLSATFSQMFPISLADFQAAGVELSLPRIVVIGDESHGKSSVLERLAQAPLFPRDNNFCTRMPFILKLKQGPAQPIHLCCQSRAGAVLRDAHGIPMERSIECTGDMERLETLGRQIKDEMRLIIEAATSQADDGESIITSHLMEINIQSPYVHTMELIDLPGLVVGTAREQGLQLIREYLNEQHDTLVVCVVSDQLPSLRTSLTLAEVWQRPYLHARTVVALTNVDKTNDNFGPEPSRLMRRVSGELGFDLTPHSIVPVINLRRDGDTFEHATEEEQKEFARIQCNLVLAGVQDLADSLVHLARAHLKEHWLPRQRSIISNDIAGHELRLTAMGTLPQLHPLDELANRLAQRIRLTVWSPDTLHELLGMPTFPQALDLSENAVLQSAMARGVFYEYVLRAADSLRQSQTVGAVVSKAAMSTVLHRIDFDPLLKQFRSSVPDQLHLSAVAWSMVRSRNIMSELQMALYDWLIVPLIAYLEGGWVAVFDAAGEHRPSELHETATAATERQEERDNLERRAALLSRLERL